MRANHTAAGPPPTTSAAACVGGAPSGTLAAMTPDATVLRGAKLLDECERRVARGPGATALFCDIDGTISPIAPTPAEAVVPAAFRAVLAALVQRLGLLVFATGRDVLDGRRMIDPARRPLLRQPRHAGAGRRRQHRHLPRGAALCRRGSRGADPGPAAREAPAGPLRRRQGHRRRAALPAHRRQGRRSHLHQRGRVRTGAALGLDVVTGKQALEVRPPVAVSKGTATEAMLRQGEFATALFFGDDLTDVDGFTAVTAGLRRTRTAHRVRRGRGRRRDPSTRSATPRPCGVRGPTASWPLLRAPGVCDRRRRAASLAAATRR